jgi:hypothetical protein
MSDQPNADENQKNALENKLTEQVSPGTTTSPNSDQGASGAEKSKSTQDLSPDEQMALYEKELKENDWGHQPC